MPWRPTNDDENVLRARGTHPTDRGILDRRASDRLLAQVLPPWVEPLVSVGKRAMTPNVPRSSPSPRVFDQVKPALAPRGRLGRESERYDLDYSAAFRPDFFPHSREGYDAGEKRALDLRDT